MFELPPILIAEDDDDDFALFRRAFRQAGIENPLLRFRDGSQLIEYLETAPALHREAAPVLIFVDLAMPLVGGFEVLAWLQEHRPRQFWPVVLSGSRREEDMKRAFNAGAEEYVTKPLSPILLAALVCRPAEEHRRDSGAPRQAGPVGSAAR
jgi:CheY-like chemotaxis protein